MSYTYQQYGTGYNIAMPTPEAQSLNEILNIHGTPATIIHRTPSGENTYGNPTYSETIHQTTCIRRTKLFQRNHPAGNLDTTHDTILLAAWEAITETDQVELDGARYHIAGILRTPALIKAELEATQ